MQSSSNELKHNCDDKENSINQVTNKISKETHRRLHGLLGTIIDGQSSSLSTCATDWNEKTSLHLYCKLICAKHMPNSEIPDMDEK